MSLGYVELQVTTNYSFLRGASHPEELFAHARALGYEALGITDRNSVAGMVRAHVAAEAAGVCLIAGCRLDLSCGAGLLVYPTDRPAWSRLCRLLSLGKGRAGKGACHLGWDDVAAHGEGLIAVLLPAEPDAALSAKLQRLRADFGDRAFLALTRRFRPGEQMRLAGLAALAAAARVPAVVTNDVLYHQPERRILQDVLSCIRLGCTIDDAGFRRERHAGRVLQSPEEMARLFPAFPEAVARTEEIAGRCHFNLAELRYQYPEEVLIPGLSPQQALERLVWEGAAGRYPGGVPEKVVGQLRHELDLIGELHYAPYFLTVHAIVRYARAQGILCQGRGSAANSAVCFVLGITAIDPERNDLLFERFVSAERGEPPDIDVDFEHERREEVIQWIYQTYGRARAALTATVIRYRTRGAIREVGKALGIPEEKTAALAREVSSWSREAITEEQVAALHLDPNDRRLGLALRLAGDLIGFPRHLSQHPGGFVLTRDRLDELVPIEPAAMADRQVIEWDKEDIDALGMMKVDVLGLGMLGCLRRAFDLLAAQRGIALDMATIPPEDPATYAMIRRADTIGVFQIESRAQMAMLPRLKPRTFYDLVIEVAIVRPGPIQGDMVHPYLRRREGKEPVEYPTPELERVLGKTLGVPLFQEQAMQVAIACAGFTPSEADQLRRAMATFRFTGTVSTFRDKLIVGMTARGYSAEFADRTFRQIEGFGSYGFPESHAASFALIAYASSWLKCHHPEIFCAALLNAQPMGFYAPAQIVRDAREHGIEVRPVCVNQSRWDCTLERDEVACASLSRSRSLSDRVIQTAGRSASGHHALEPVAGSRLAVRLGMRMVKGLADREAADIIAARGENPYRSPEEVWRRAGAPIAALERLAEADAFAALGLDRRQALWAIKALPKAPLPLFAAASADPARPAPEIVEPPFPLPPMPPGREVVEDYASLGLSLRRHPLFFLRADLARLGMQPASALATARDGSRIRLAGLVLMRQRPGSASGVTFVTIEDETGHANLIVWPSLFEKARRVLTTATMLGCTGKVQREGIVIHVVCEQLLDLSHLLHEIGDRNDVAPVSTMAEERGKSIQVKTRDFR